MVIKKKVNLDVILLKMSKSNIFYFIEVFSFFLFDNIISINEAL